MIVRFYSGSFFICVYVLLPVCWGMSFLCCFETVGRGHLERGKCWNFFGISVPFVPTEDGSSFSHKYLGPDPHVWAVWIIHVYVNNMWRQIYLIPRERATRPIRTMYHPTNRCSTLGPKATNHVPIEKFSRVLYFYIHNHTGASSIGGPLGNLGFTLIATWHRISRWL